MILLKIPLISDSSDQTVNVTLDNIPYTFRILWNERFGYFSLTISELDGDAILTNIKMVNNYPLVGRHQKLTMKGDLFFVHNGGKTTRPNYDSLGREYNLYYYDPETALDYPVPSLPIGLVA